MTDKSPKKLSELLATGRLAALGREAERRRTTTERIRALLPAEEAEHLLSASTSADGELVLVMDSAVWAARVRSRGAELGARRRGGGVVAGHGAEQRGRARCPPKR